MPAVDRSKLFMKMMSDAYNSHGIWDKISMVFTMFGMVSSVVIPQVLFDFVGLGTKSSRNYDVEKVTENIWKVKYWGNQSSCIIIKGADGSLLMSSCPEAQDHTIEQVAKLGPVGAIMIPNMGHDSYAHQWKEKYPDAKVYCPEADVKEMEKGVAIEGSIEGSLPALGNWGVKEVISDDGNFRFSLPLIRIQTQIADRKINALMVTCGVCNWPKTIFSPRYWFFGLVGFRFPRQFALIFVKDIQKTRAWIKKISSIPDVEMLLLQHGPPFIGKNANARLEGILLSRSLFS